MSGVDTERIKEKFYTKLKEAETMRNKRLKVASIVAVAVAFSLTGISAFAASRGIFDTLFRNFADVASRLNITSESSKSNGITMTLSSYLADTKGLVAELVFTKNDGSSFAEDTQAIYTDGYVSGHFFDTPSLSINNINRSVYTQNKVSDDGKAYYCLPIVHYDIEQITNSILDIRVDKLVYDIKESVETVELDLYEAYKAADIKTYDIGDDWDGDLKKIFNDVKDNPIQSPTGVTIDAIVFAKAKSIPKELPEGAPPADGVDMAALSSHKYDNLVAIKFTDNLKIDDTEYYFLPENLVNNQDPLGMGLGIDENTSYRFFRVNDFEDLQHMKGIDFSICSNRVIEGDWHIKTTFASNQDITSIDINEELAVEELGTVITLTKADISLLSTRLTFEIKDSDGKVIDPANISGYDMNIYYLNDILANKIKLLYSDGSEAEFMDSYFNISNGVILVRFSVEMNPRIYTLMNTSKLQAIVIKDKKYLNN